MPTPLTSCIHIQEIISEAEEVKSTSLNYAIKKQLVESECQRKRYGEAEALKTIIKVPECLLAGSRQKMAGFRVVEDTQISY